MPKLISFLFKLVPETSFKHYFRCFIYNRMQKDFTITYNGQVFLVKKDSIEMKFTENPFHIIQTDKDYFRTQQLTEGDVVIDAGTYIGVFTIYASKKVGSSGKVYAFEPDPQTLKKLKQNLSINGVSNVVLVDKGLWSEETNLIFKKGQELSSSFIIDSSGGDNSDVIEVPVTTIDNVLGEEVINGRLFIKMNIEGSEIEALKGAVKTTARHKPFMVIRTNHIVDGATTDKPVESFLKQFGYKTTTLQLSELTTFAQAN